jgi:hypothetical protein
MEVYPDILTRKRRKEKSDFSMPGPILFYNNAEVKGTFSQRDDAVAM